VNERTKTLITVAVSIGCSLVAGELLFRAILGVPVFQLTNYRNAEVVRHNLSGQVEYDPLLGWRQKPNFHLGGFNTIEYGLRRSSSSDDHVRTGGILVVGASFTTGSEVTDEEAWPAQLEAIMDQPVLNGGVGGYGVDQAVLHAEELLPLVHPKMLVVDLSPENVLATGFSYMSYSKPYFTIEPGGLRLQNYPVPKYQKTDPSFDLRKDVLGYVLAFDRLMATYYPNYWYSMGNVRSIRADNDEVAVSCMLLERLKGEADKAGIRMLVSMQHGGANVLAQTEIPAFVHMTEDCARADGIPVVDEFEVLKTMSKTDMEGFRSLYVSDPVGVLGHKSRKGNRLIAEIVAGGLKRPVEAPSPREKSTVVLVPIVKGDGKNLLSHSEDLEEQIDGSSIASFSKTPGSSSAMKIYRIQGVGPAGEHYVGMSLGALDGPLTLSLDACPEGTFKLRLQLLAGGSDGVLGEFDLDQGSASIVRIGRALNIRGGASAAQSCWRRLWITANLPTEAPSAVILFQLADKTGSYIFDPVHESVLIRAVQVESGNTASAYQPTP
jgi:hypothetical protein